MYVWRIRERHAPNFDLPRSCGINYHCHIRRGRYYHVPRVSHQAPPAVQTIRYGSFAIRGPRLFNTLPSEWHNMTNCSIESFKHGLNIFLNTIPDEPQTPGLSYMRRGVNSLIRMTAARTNVRHPSLSEELGNMPQARCGQRRMRPLMVTSGLNPETIDSYRQVSKQTPFTLLSAENWHNVYFPNHLILLINYYALPI